MLQYMCVKFNLHNMRTIICTITVLYTRIIYYAIKYMQYTINLAELKRMWHICCLLERPPK